MSDTISTAIKSVAVNLDNPDERLRVIAFVDKWSATLDMLDTVDPGDIVAAMVEMCGRVK